MVGIGGVVGTRRADGGTPGSMRLRVWLLRQLRPLSEVVQRHGVEGTWCLVSYSKKPLFILIVVCLITVLHEGYLKVNT